MSKWLDTLLKELDEIKPDDFVEIEIEVGTNEHMVVELSYDDLKPFVLASKLIQMAHESMSAAYLFSISGDTEAEEKMLLEATKLHEKADILIKIFWCSIMDTYNLWGKSIGIRKGRKIVRIEEKETKSSGICIGFFNLPM